MNDIGGMEIKSALNEMTEKVNEKGNVGKTGGREERIYRKKVLKRKN